ncbi:LCP family protein [Corynebacterium sp. HMSC29G08]|uniref:LCP family protein n=1 Tax=Corynebacterium sp. HMSC29G08 TaxID=1581069 RepID=UPI0008A2EF53|nr:LCP family protein [Corynebacterium sp. HMSC29G08]OFT85245.1 LytR family transcriptional regulator [Corynebacterium sp. HMSC29G08]
MDNREDRSQYVYGKDGKPLLDRYGRPVRRRDASGETSRRTSEYRSSEYQPRRTPHEQRARQIMPDELPQRPVQQRPVQQRREPVPMQVHERPRPKPKPRPRPRRKRPGCVGCGSLVILTVLVLSIVGMLLADARLNRTQAMPTQQVANTAGTNWLFVGSDSRTGMSQDEIDRLGTGGDIGSTRTDTIMLMHIPRAGQATLMSIPRDSYVEVPGYGYDKINAAFAYGGASLLVQTVEQSTGLHIDHYAEIGMGGLANVVDAVGGVEICVAEPITDPLANISLAPGCQKMDGATGLGYVRTRATALGDLDRVVRQREFLAAVMSKVTSPATLLNPFRTIPLVWTTPAMFTVDQGDHVWSLARVALAMRGGVRTETIPIYDFMDTDVGNVAIWDDAGAQALFDSLK